MLTKNERNSIKALRSRENRHLENKMVVEGTKGILELLNSSIVTNNLHNKWHQTSKKYHTLQEKRCRSHKREH